MPVFDPDINIQTVESGKRIASHWFSLALYYFSLAYNERSFNSPLLGTHPEKWFIYTAYIQNILFWLNVWRSGLSGRHTATYFAKCCGLNLTRDFLCTKFFFSESMFCNFVSWIFIKFYVILDILLMREMFL